MGDSPNHIFSILVNHKETVVVVWFLIVSLILYRSCRNGNVESSTRSHRAHSVQEEMRRRSILGLDWETLNALPVFVYTSQAVKEKLECSICLSELAENEMCRLLPNCNHSFHAECIDMWLFSHNSCPLCRTNAQPSTNVQSSINAGPSHATNSENVEGDNVGGINSSAGELPSSSNAASGNNNNAGNGHAVPENRRFRFSNPPRIFFWMDQGSSGERTLPQIVIHIPTAA